MNRNGDAVVVVAASVPAFLDDVDVDVGVVVLVVDVVLLRLGL